MKKILIFNFLMLSLFNFAHPVTPEMMQLKGSPDFLFGVFFFMMSAGTFYFSPKWGSKIDKIGTRKILIIAPIFYAVGQLIFAYFSNPIIMSLGRFISGAFASGWIVGVSSYINLKSKPDEKIKNFGYQLVTTNLGGVVGQLLSGKIGSYNVYFSFVFQIFFLLVVAFVLSMIIEDLYPEVRLHAKTSFKNTINQLKNNNYLLLMLSLVCFATITSISRSMPSYFGSDVAGFNTAQIGAMNAYVNGLAMISNLFILRVLEKKFSFFDAYLIQGITCIFGATLIIFSIIKGIDNIYYLLLFMVALTLVTIGSSIYRPFVQKEIVNSKKFDQGEILGVINSFNAIGMLLSSGSMSVLYPLNPILPFLAMLLFAILATGLHISSQYYEK